MRITLAQRFAEHHTGTHHPERPERIEAFIAGLEAGGCPRTDLQPATPAPLPAILSVHGAAYVAGVERICLGLASDDIAELPTGDTIVSRSSYEIALEAAGAALTAAEQSTAGDPTLAITRPPGHHATPDRGMGFCIFNNIAIAAEQMRRNAGPVIVADFDYHHGNGTQAWVERELRLGDGPPIGFISSHAYPAYPGSGAFAESRIGESGFIIDVPLPLSTVTDDFIAVWASLLPPLVRRLRPAALLVSAGFDFLAGDPIAGLPVSLRAVDALCALFGSVASERGIALSFIFEGGYSLENLTASGASMARTFNDGQSRATHAPGAGEPASPKLRAIVREVLSWL
ncbi:MAG TPA: histone deacetylase [Candidatus Eremiobacteraceae bacterium]|nr:histone deacetylase [Candidatus Eremiobacteraceae bacterium]